MSAKVSALKGPRANKSKPGTKRPGVKSAAAPKSAVKQAGKVGGVRGKAGEALPGSVLPASGRVAKRPAKSDTAPASKSARSKPAKSPAQPGVKGQAKPRARKDVGALESPAPLRKRRTKAAASSTTGARQKKRVFSASTSDSHELYQMAVQSPVVDAIFLSKLYKKLRGREARHVREDFCGTAYFISAWLRRHRENTAEGYDIDGKTIAWGKQHNFEGLADWQERTQLFTEDVRQPSQQRPDLRFAPNFSWMIFTERSVLLDYFKRVREDLADGGLFVFDIYGGWESAEEMIETRKLDVGFSYLWEQKAYHPASGFYHCAIHFRFKDGTSLNNVYDYKWRLWNLPEVIDILRDAGFSQVDSYWEGTDEDGVGGNGVFKKDSKGENCPAWVTYVVAQP